MRTIIIIQTLIIIAGGFYIYNLNKMPKTEVKTDSPSIVIPADKTKNIHSGYTPPTGNPPSQTPATTTKGAPSHSDAGMEFPSLDEGSTTTVNKPISH